MPFKTSKNICIICLCFTFFLIFFLVSLVKIKEKNYYVLSTNVKEQPGGVVNLEVLEEKKSTNPDIKGIIQIDGTKINELIVQGSDNSYYLRRDINKNKNKKGAIFLDYRVSLDSRKMLIYGHSSTSFYVPFNELEKYYNKDFFEKHKYIDMITKGKHKRYEIFSVVIETEDWTYMNLNFTTLEDWYHHLKKWKDKSLYETSIDVSKDDNIIILQTCSHHEDYKKYKKKYLLVMGREIR